MAKDIISESLNIRSMQEIEEENSDQYLPAVYEEISNELVTKEELSVSVLSDIEEAQDNIKELLRIGVDAVKELSDIAKSSQDRKDFDALSSLLTTALSMNREIIDIHKKKIDMEVKKIESTGGPTKTVNEGDTINNNLVICTTDELDEIMKRFQK